MSMRMLGVIVTTIKKVQTKKDPDEFTDLPVQLILPGGISYENARESCLEFIGTITEMEKIDAENAKKVAEEKTIEPEVTNLQ